jgi:hypothetical protein
VPANAAANRANRRWTHAKNWLHNAALITIGVAAVVLPLLRAFQLVRWPWGLAFAPFTTIGMVFAIMMAAVSLRPTWIAFRARAGTLGAGAGTTPPPEQLAPPQHAEDADERILADHPELLAALCHGFRKLRFVPTVLGRPVTDPWAVYEAAVSASSIDLLQLRLLARRHVERFAGFAKGRRPSEAQVMKRAIEAFQKCSTRSLGSRVDPDCSFEHIVVIFGTQSSPNRDTHLASLAPKVRVLLERQYPQLATTRLDDGSHMKYAEWNKQAALDRAELARLQRDQVRLAESVEETASQLKAARAQVASLHDAAETTRREARTAARAEQGRLTDELRATIERAQQEHTRQLQRADGERDRLQETVDELSAERDMFERLLFSSADEDTVVPAETDGLAGLRVVLVGGEEAQMPPIREHLEALGIQFVQQDGSGAADKVAGAHLVVLWIRYVSHPTAFTIKRECRNRRVPLTYWTRTSPASLAALIAQAAASADVASPGS